MRRLPVLLLVALATTVGCNTSKLGHDHPATATGAKEISPSEEYASANRTTPAAPAKSFAQGTGTNTGDAKDHQKPDRDTSTPATDVHGPQQMGHTNETNAPEPQQ